MKEELLLLVDRHKKALQHIDKLKKELDEALRALHEANSRAARASAASASVRSISPPGDSAVTTTLST